MNDAIDRGDVEALRAELASAIDRRQELQRHVRRPLPGRMPPAVLGIMAALVAGAAGAVGYWSRPAPPPLPAALIDREQTLRASLETEERIAQRPAPDEGSAPPEPIPTDAYPALATLRTLADPDQEAVLAWAQIGIAACTVESRELAREAHRRLSLEGFASRPRPGARMHPAIAKAMLEVDRSCQDRRIHLSAP